MGICYIVGAGDFYGSINPTKGDMIIAADGGMDTLRGLGLTPDLLVGDLDSIEQEETDVSLIRHPIEKDETDTFLSYLEGVKRGYTSFAVYGGVGGRLDHTFANISLLLYAKRRGHSMTLVDDKMSVSVIKNESVTITGDMGRGFSLLAFAGEARGVSIEGAKYCVDDATLTPEFPLGVSNSLTDKDCRITVTDGELIFMLEN